MEDQKSMKSLNENIIHILSLYKQLNPLQLWYELNDVNNGKDRVSVADIERTLEHLHKRGVVEKISLKKDYWALKSSETQYTSSWNK